MMEDLVQDPRAMIDATYTEAQWQNQIIRAAKSAGWELIYHTWNARHSTAGFPDLILVRDGRMLAIEVKKQDPKSTVTAAQAQWIKALDEVAGVTAFVARPSDWDRVVEALVRMTIAETEDHMSPKRRGSPISWRFDNFNFGSISDYGAVELWECPSCGFSFDAIHTDDGSDGKYRCAECGASPDDESD